MINTPKNITTIDDKKGQSFSVVGDTYRIIISGKQTGGSYAVIDMLIPPGGGPGPHAHPNMQETFYILEGEIDFKTESGNYIARKGSFVNIPLGGIVHCFKNTTDSTAHLLCTVIPSGLEELFQEIGKPVEAGAFLPPPVLNLEELQRLKTLAEKYGQRLYPPDYLN
jgi:quercetin dioxygenase-like cupin family protein